MAAIYYFDLPAQAGVLRQKISSFCILPSAFILISP